MHTDCRSNLAQQNLTVEGQQLGQDLGQSDGFSWVFRMTQGCTDLLIRKLARNSSTSS